MSEGQTVENVARALAAAHRNEDPETQEIYLSRAADEVRLVEVSGSVGDSGEVLPFRFGAQPSRGIPYPSTIILLSPREWERIRLGELSLPEGWGDPSSLERIG